MTKMTKAVAAAVLAMGASAAQAGITIPAGDWTIDIGGNVNAYYTNTRFDGDLKNDIKGTPTHESSNNISTGLLPSALGIGGKTRQNDLDIAFQFTFFTGVDSSSADTGDYGAGSGLGNGLNSLNIRQAFLTFGDKSWGTIKMGRDLGIFGSDAILSDMTLLGVGVGAGGNGNSTLGRIGSGYLYADWVGQIQYASPNWNGFSFAVAAREPWGDSANHDLGFDGKASYEWGGDVSGKVWVGGIHQKTRTADSALNAGDGFTNDANVWEIGGKVNVASFGLVGYYYDGKNMGGADFTNATLTSGLSMNNSKKDHDVSGGYVQGTWTAPFGTKFGLSWGESINDKASGAGPTKDDFKSESWVIGAYHPLTKSLNLVAEYTDNKIENNDYDRTMDGKAKTMALGAILFF